MPTSQARKSGLIATVSPGSLAAEAGLRPGDQVLEINGQPIRDQIDYRFETTESVVELTVVHAGERGYVEFTKEPDEALGIEFTDDAFDATLLCNNNCFFCFLKGLPKGLRKTLYVKDDDYRLSFLHGNFVTLTNLTEADWQRMASQRLSPLNVSVHATDLELRRALLSNPAAPDIMAQMRRLAAIGVDVQTQVVLCPGVNDGAALDRTVEDLLSCEAVQNIAVVPVGSSLDGEARSRHPGMRAHTPAEARAVLRQLRRWQRHARRTCGRTVVYPADEFYLAAEARIPAARTYDGFPQWENGIGMVRTLLDDWSRTRRRLRARNHAAAPARRLTIACGALIAPTLDRIAVETSTLLASQIEVVPIVNTLFGPRVNVSGLLPGQAFIDQLRGRDLGERVLLPRASLDHFGRHFLDDLTPTDVSEALGCPVAFAYTWSESIEWMAARSVREPPVARAVSSHGLAWSVAG